MDPSDTLVIHGNQITVEEWERDTGDSRDSYFWRTIEDGYIAGTYWSYVSLESRCHREARGEK